MNKWIAEFDLEDGDTMPEHMDLNYKGAHIDFHCRPMWIPVSSGNLPDYEQDVLVQLECNDQFCHMDDERPMKYDVARRIDYKHPMYDADYYWEGKFAYNPAHVIAWQLPEPCEEDKNEGIS